MWREGGGVCSVRRGGRRGREGVCSVRREGREEKGCVM